MSGDGFANVEVIDPYVEKGWSPQASLTLATDQEVVLLEQTIGSFPIGYREYVTSIGRGEYCNYIKVQLPDEILNGYLEYQKFLD